MATRGRRACAVLAGTLALATGVLCGASCVSGRPLPAASPEEPAEWAPPQGIRIEGVEVGCWNFCHAFNAWGTQVVEERPGGLLASEGDLLMVMTHDVYGIMPYALEYGSTLSLKIEGPRLLLGGTVVVLLSPEEPAAGQEGTAAWLMHASRGELAGLRCVVSAKEPGPEDIRALKRLATVNPNVGLVVEDVEVLRQVLPLFQPRWLLLSPDDPMKAQDVELIAACRQLEVLLFGAEELENLEFLTRLPALRKLVMAGWAPEKTGVFPPGCERLESLTLAEVNMKDLSPVAGLKGLHEIQWIGCTELADLSALSDLPQLEGLTLSGCTALSDLSALKALRNLKSLCLPPQITQEQFAAVIQEHPGLSVLELVGCEAISDLSPLKDLAGLEALVVVGTPADCKVLEELKSLRFLGLESGDSDEEFQARASELEKALPQCLVVPVGPICLGSGWILLLFPALALLGLASSRARSRRPKPRPLDA